MARKQWWGVIVCLSVFMMVGGVARSASYPGDSGNISDTSFVSIFIDDDADRTFTNDITITDNGSIGLHGTGTTVFEGNVSRNQLTLNNSNDQGLYITKGENIFKGTVSVGYLTSDYEGGNNTTTFEKAVTLWDEDRDPSDNEPLTGYAIGLSGGTFTFKDDVTITQSGKHASFIGTTATFAKHLNAGTGDVEIGVSGRVKTMADGYGYPLPNTPSKVILDGASAQITAANVNIYNNGVLQLDSAADVNGKLNILEGGKATSGSGNTLTLTGGMRMWNGSSDFAGAVSISDDLFINGKSNAIFRGALTVANDIQIMNESDMMSHGQETANAVGSTNEFYGAIQAGVLAIDTEAGSSTNTFHETVTLNKFDTDIPGNNTSLIVIDGTNTFAKDVVTGNKHALFAKSTATFAAHLNAGSGDVLIGFGGAVSSLADARYNQTARVTLNGNTARITAANTNVYSKGILDVRGNATVTGNLNFKSGSEFSIDAPNLLTVSGATTIEAGALANVRGVDPVNDIGKTILTSAGGITGQFRANGLYKVEAEGTTLKITGRNRVEDVLAESNIVTANSATTAGMVTSIISDPNADPVLVSNLSDTVQDITDLADTNPGLAKIAAAQLFGEHGVTGVTASQTTAQNFSGSVGNHQTQLRDNSQASAAPASANSTSAYASFRTTRRSASSFNPNRIWGGGFGAWTRQDDKNNQSGYKYNSGGFILGYDREFGVSPTGSFVAGLSSAYSAGEIENNDGFTTTDVDTFNVGVYASYNHRSGFFADVNAGLGFSWNDVDTADIIAGGNKTGEYDTTSFQLGGTAGYAVTLPEEFRIVPSVGLQFNHVSQEAWSERTQNAAQIAHSFGKSNSNSLTIPVQVRVNKTFRIGAASSITPEVRGAWIYEAHTPQARVRMGYVGSSASTTLYGMDVGRSRGLVGAGVKMKFGRTDAFVDYNYEFRSSYDNHNLMGGLGLSF